MDLALCFHKRHVVKEGEDDSDRSSTEHRALTFSPRYGRNKETHERSNYVTDFTGCAPVQAATTNYRVDEQILTLVVCFFTTLVET